MNETRISNEQKIFSAIQELKDSIFGLKQSYTEFCYDYSEETGLFLDPEKTNDFANNLLETSKPVRYYDSDFEEIFPLFIKMSVIFLDATCNPSDWLFVSIRKIGKTIYEEDPQQKSTFEIMVNNAKEAINSHHDSKQFWDTYELFQSKSSLINMRNFGQYVKLSVERFIDDNGLNYLDDTKATEMLISRINRTSSIIAKEVQRKSRS